MQNIWKQRFTLEENQTGYWQIGSMEMWMLRREGCLEIYHQQGFESHPNSLVVDIKTERPIPAPARATRIALPQESTALRFAPLTADRPVVVRPDQPFYVLARSETRLYLNTPLWMSIHSEPSQRALLEFPLYRLSDTWFGPSTREGELCYATRTRASLLAPRPPTAPHRAFTALRLINRSNEPILLERVNLPVPNLTLFQAADDSLWTPSVVLDIGDDKGEASLHLDAKPAEEAGECTEITAPRQRAESNLLKRALGALIG